MPDILVVDDEQEIADLVELYLKNEGYTLYKCYDGAQALEQIAARPFDLAILDVMLPETSGFDLCRKIREAYTYPVIMLTARTQEMDKVTGLMTGADDYVTKPFNPLELVARVKAQLRRSTRYNAGTAPESHVIDFSGLEINKDTHECRLYDQPVDLTPTEFSLLWMLCQNRGKVLSAEELFEGVWGEKYLDSNNTVMVHIRKLRAKIEDDPQNPRIVKTVWGKGYRVE